MTHISNTISRPTDAGSLWKLCGHLLLLWVTSLPAMAADDADHLHDPVSVDPSLDWATLIDETLRNFPSFVELASRDSEATALIRRGRSWLAGQPTMRFRYQSDSMIDKTGLREYEAGLELPLWRPGQRASARAVGAAATTESDAATLALRHDVIGLLRTVLWDIERATKAKALADDGLGVAEALLRVVQRRYKAGELPLTDALLARNALMQREAIAIEAEAALFDAERSYRSLTNLGARPAVFVETLSAVEDFDGTHPAVRLADAELERARAEFTVIDESARGAPTLTIGPRREQAASSNFQNDSLGLSVTVPFGGRPQRAVQTAAAGRRVASAESARAQLLRELDLNLHEARHSLVVIEASLDLTRQREALAATHMQMSETAFEQGEMTLFELLQQQETARLTQHEVARLEVEREYTIAQINQALGEWP